MKTIILIGILFCFVNAGHLVLNNRLGQIRKSTQQISLFTDSTTEVPTLNIDLGGDPIKYQTYEAHRIVPNFAQSESEDTQGEAEAEKSAENITETYSMMGGSDQEYESNSGMLSGKKSGIKFGNQYSGSSGMESSYGNDGGSYSGSESNAGYGSGIQSCPVYQLDMFQFHYQNYQCPNNCGYTDKSYRTLYCSSYPRSVYISFEEINDYWPDQLYSACASFHEGWLQCHQKYQNRGQCYQQMFWQYYANEQETFVYGWLYFDLNVQIKHFDYCAYKYQGWRMTYSDFSSGFGKIFGSPKYTHVQY